MSSSLNCLPADSLLNDGITKTDDNKSQHGDDGHAMDLPNQISIFAPHLITESRLSNEPHKRVKRVHVFRPLFVYRQEQIKRKRIIEKRKQRSQKPNADPNRPVQPSKPCTCCDKCQQY